jgi:HAMP domain-containing protein
MTVTVSELSAPQYARDLAGPGVAVVVRERPKILGSSIASSNASGLAAGGNVTVRGTAYRAVGQSFPSFGGARVTVTVLSALSATATSLGGTRAVAAVLIVAFLALAFGFSMLASRALQGRLSGFLQAARRLGSGDFSSPIRVEGNDEFAALGIEFNSMSSELSRRLDELTRERVRLR